MGPTIVLPGSHLVDLQDATTTTTTGSSSTLLPGVLFNRATLNKGDIMVMDARCMHFGSANTTGDRRVLLYFTIRNPHHGDKDADFPDCASLYEDLKGMTIESVLNPQDY
jgi:ectoine hydroxylase-related dioxygenase (phytanoyl-CoA dioxygenase family)